MKILSILTAFIFTSLLLYRYFSINYLDSEGAKIEKVPTAKKNIEELISNKKKSKNVSSKNKKNPRKVRSSHQKLELKKVVKVKLHRGNKSPQKTSYDFKEFVYVDENKNLYVESVFIDGDDVVSFGDVLIGDKEDVLNRAKKGESVSINKPVPWDEGEIPYVIHPELDQIKDDIFEAMKVLQEATGGLVSFKEKVKDENYLSFEKGNQNCYSFVGMQGGAKRSV